MRESYARIDAARIRLSATAEAELLADARRVRAGRSGATLTGSALEALLARNRAEVVDDSDTAYDRLPLDEPEVWGDLAWPRRAAGSA